MPNWRFILFAIGHKASSETIWQKARSYYGDFFTGWLRIQKRQGDWIGSCLYATWHPVHCILHVFFHWHWPGCFICGRIGTSMRIVWCLCFGVCFCRHFCVVVRVINNLIRLRLWPNVLQMRPFYRRSYVIICDRMRRYPVKRSANGILRVMVWLPTSHLVNWS